MSGSDSGGELRYYYDFNSQGPLGKYAKPAIVSLQSCRVSADSSSYTHKCTGERGIAAVRFARLPETSLR